MRRKSKLGEKGSQGSETRFISGVTGGRFARLFLRAELMVKPFSPSAGCVPFLLDWT